MEEIVKFAMITLAILVALNFYVRGKILNLLRESHKTVWEDLGSPSLVKNNSFENGMATLRFIWGRGYQRLNDRSLGQFVRAERMLHVMQGAVFLVALLLMVAALILK